MKANEYLKRPYSRVVVPESDGTFRSEILEFPGCIATGDTAAEAYANLEDVALSWIESVTARGQIVPEPLEENEYSGKLVVRLAKSMHQRAATAARHDGISLNAFITNCVAEQLGARKVAAHQVTYFSQQNNMVFVGKDRVPMNQTIASSQTIVSPALRASNVQTNPWKQTNA
jgi:predicted HicB family RNase H-like nuclease